LEDISLERVFVFFYIDYRCGGMPCFDLSTVFYGHANAIVQIATRLLPEYYMQNDATKCLNTAVAIAFLMMGPRALDITRSCDVSNVKERYRHGNMSLKMAKALAYDIFHDDTESEHDRYLYYIMITDGHMPLATDPNTSIYEPGHVFLIGRDGLNKNQFSLFQSFIKRYTLDDHLSSRNSSSYTKEILRDIVNGIIHLFHTQTWDKQCSLFWQLLTGISGKKYEGYVVKNNVFLCYHKVRITNCIGNLEHTLKSVASLIENKSLNEKFVKDGITNREMKLHIETMLQRLQKYTS
jgi:hypothetical protein